MSLFGVNHYCNRLSPKRKSQQSQGDIDKFIHCNRLSPKRKSQLKNMNLRLKAIVTDYRLNANHNKDYHLQSVCTIVTDYRLNANHNNVPTRYISQVL